MIEQLRDRRTSLYLGVLAVGLGLSLILNALFPWTWIVFLIGIGAVQLAVSIRWHKGSGFAIGSLALTFGFILLYQRQSGQWQSWNYLWALVFAVTGAALMLSSKIQPGTGWGYGRYRLLSWSFMVLGTITTIGLWFLRAQVAWPVIVWGSGALLLASALYSRIYPLAIPGALLYGTGIILAWFQFTGAWHTWYAWLLVPAFLGVGIGLAFLRNRVMRIISLLVVLWSLISFAIFALLIAEEGRYAQFWPLLFIVVGAAVAIHRRLIRQTKLL